MPIINGAYKSGSASRNNAGVAISRYRQRKRRSKRMAQQSARLRGSASISTAISRSWLARWRIAWRIGSRKRRACWRRGGGSIAHLNKSAAQRCWRRARHARNGWRGMRVAPSSATAGIAWRFRLRAARMRAQQRNAVACLKPQQRCAQRLNISLRCARQLIARMRAAYHRRGIFGVAAARCCAARIKHALRRNGGGIAPSHRAANAHASACAAASISVHGEKRQRRRKT